MQTLENNSYIYCLNQLSPELVVSGCEDGSIRGEAFSCISYSHSNIFHYQISFIKCPKYIVKKTYENFFIH